MLAVKFVYLLLCVTSFGISTLSAAVSCVDLKMDSSISQMLLLNGNPNSITKATLQSCAKVNGSWVNVLPNYDVVVGKNGIAEPHQKVEGDSKTPSGTFRIGEFFGWTPASDSVVQKFQNDYRYIVDVKDENGIYLDKFIDDVESHYYNTWVAGPTAAKSYEQMRISPYQYGLVINYNMFPTVAGKGSAIFMHIWSGPEGSTAGCVALDESNLISVLQWLDKSMQPHIKIVPASSLLDD